MRNESILFLTLSPSASQLQKIDELQEVSNFSSTLVGIGISIFILDTFLLFQLIRMMRQYQHIAHQASTNINAYWMQKPEEIPPPGRQQERILATLLFSLAIIAFFLFLMLTGKTTR